MRYALAASIEVVTGRRNLVRGSRFLLDYARRDLPNTLGLNGEWMVQDTVLDGFGTERLVAVDVGANIGAWSLRFLSGARSRGLQVQVHSFEPASATFGQLSRNLLPSFEGAAVLVRCAASDHTGHATLFKVHELAGSNSLYPATGSIRGLHPETVALCTLDDYCREAGVERIDLLKIDAEGHDHAVLAGARRLLECNAIRVVQFEYNCRWIDARHYLKDVFDDLGPLGYNVGKVTPSGVEWYEGWAAELETFREGNYVAAPVGLRERFPMVAWWRSTRS